MPNKRVAIIGTAPSWRKAPYDDPSIQLWSLNDAYSLGMPRADQWFDLHPIPKMWFRPANKRVFKEGDIPEGVYVRPEGHVEWMKTRAKTIPVWLQQTPPEDWPINAQRFPFERAKAFLKARPDQEAYVASSPALILAHAILEGFTEIHIYGIHLATQGEYIKQRPGFEWLLGKAEAMGIQIVLPPECPLLKHSHVYAYEPEPVSPDVPARKRLAGLNQQYSAIVQQIVELPRWKSKADLNARLVRLRAEIRDAQMQGKHALASAGAI
jgi:hypothetical protein